MKTQMYRTLPLLLCLFLILVAGCASKTEEDTKSGATIAKDKVHQRRQTDDDALQSGR